MRRNVENKAFVQFYLRNISVQHLFQGDGQTALHIASAEGDETLVKYFYGVRASASITDHQDRTPMHLAAENGHASVIELLADKFKASIFERTKDGSTLMHIASLNGHSECATMLFKKGVYLHMPNKRGARSIHTAAKYGHVGIISTLLQRGEKVSYLSSKIICETAFLSANGYHYIPHIYFLIFLFLYIYTIIISKSFASKFMPNLSRDSIYTIQFGSYFLSI